MYIPVLTERLRIPAKRRCKRCGFKVYHSDVRGYSFVCHECDENLFKFETTKEDA